MAGIAWVRTAAVLTVAAIVGCSVAHARGSVDDVSGALERAEHERDIATLLSTRLSARAAHALAELEALRAAAAALDVRRAKAGERLRTRGTMLAAMLAESGPAPADARRRLVIAELARAMVAGTAQLAELGRSRSALGRQVRTSATEGTRALAQAASAETMVTTTGARWRSALQARIATIEAKPEQTTAGTPVICLVATEELNLTRRPELRRTTNETAETRRKRSLGTELRLDQRLLREAAPAQRPKRRLLSPARPVAEHLLPISGARDGEAPDVPHRAWELELTTRVTQTVSAPVAGKVVYARRFRELGPLLIIDRGGGYHAVLVGMTRLDVREGARVVAGQSVGRIEARSDEPASLHMQLRHEGVPLDPAAWPQAYQDKVAS